VNGHRNVARSSSGAALTDPTRLAAFTDALGNWRFTDYVQFELNETAYRWLKRELDGITLKDIARLMYEFVEAGGQVDEVRETRPEWKDDYEFHYDLRIAIQDKLVYIECRLHHQIPLIPDESWILVVNIHDP
jgi:hypothetical protein